MMASQTIMPRLDDHVLERASALIKCLGHPLRLRLLEALEKGERTVSELQMCTGASQAVVSQQLSILRGRGVVEASREGPFVYYHISETKVHHILDCVRECDLVKQDRAHAASS